MIKLLIKKLKRGIWTYRQPLSLKPRNFTEPVSDLFVWRKSSIWQTFFDLYDIAVEWAFFAKHASDLESAVRWPVLRSNILHSPFFYELASFDHYGGRSCCGCRVAFGGLGVAGLQGKDFQIVGAALEAEPILRRHQILFLILQINA